MQGIYFYSGSIGIASGIFLCSFFAIGEAVVALILVVSMGLGLVWRRNPGGIAAPYVLALSVFLLGSALGLLRLEYEKDREIIPAFESKLEQSVVIEGVVVREPDQRQFSTHLYLETEYGLLLATTDRYQRITYGDRLIVEGKLRRPESFETDLGRTFDYPGYLQARGVGYMIRFAQVEVVGSGEGNPLIAHLLAFKARFMESVEAVIPEPQAGLGEGVLLGVKQALGEDLETDFRRTGIIHIVVLSGYNVMLVALAIMYCLSYFFGLRLRMVFGIIAIAGFAVMVGLGATVVRASIMAALILIAGATGRTYAIMRALFFAGIIMLMLNPYLLVFDPGFQLSFLATLALIVLAPHLERWLSFVPSFGNIREFLVATVATQLFVMPLLLYAIGELSVVSVIVNVLVLPMVPVAMILTFLAGIAGMVSSTLALPFAYLAHLSLTYIIVVAEFFSAVPLAAFSVPQFPFWVVIVTYLVTGTWLYYLYRKPAAPEVLPAAADQIDDLSDWTIEVERIKTGT